MNVFKFDLFVRLWEHSIGVAVLGGVLIGGGLTIAGGIEATSHNPVTAHGLLAFVAVLCLVTCCSAIFGLVLGGIYGVVIAAVGAIALDPYRGRAITRWVGRVLAASGGFAFDGAIHALGCLRGWSLMFSVPPLVGGLLGPLLVNWMVREAEEVVHARPTC